MKDNHTERVKGGAEIGGENMEEELRRFKYVTDNDDERKTLDKLLDDKGISRDDLMLILRTIALNESI